MEGTKDTEKTQGSPLIHTDDTDEENRNDSPQRTQSAQRETRVGWDKVTPIWEGFGMGPHKPFRILVEGEGEGCATRA